MVRFIKDIRKYHLDIGENVVIYKRVLPFIYRYTGTITPKDVARQKTKDEMSSYFKKVFK